MFISEVLEQSKSIIRQKFVLNIDQVYRYPGIRFNISVNQNDELEQLTSMISLMVNKRREVSLRLMSLSFNVQFLCLIKTYDSSVYLNLNNDHHCDHGYNVGIKLSDMKIAVSNLSNKYQLSTANKATEYFYRPQEITKDYVKLE